MKILKLIAVATLISLAGCATKQSNEQNTIPVPSDEVQLTVYGMSCPLCSNNLDGQLEKIDGIERVAVDLDTGVVTVELAPGHSVTEQQLATAVKAAGFTLHKVNPK